MYRSGLTIFRVIVCVIGMIGCASAQQIAGSGSDPDGDPEPPRCLADAEMQVTASSSRISPGESSIVTWSVSLPNGCAAVRVRLNSGDVPRSGNRTVAPLKNTNYYLTISQSQAGVFAQRSTSTRIAVNYSDHVVIDGSTPNPVQVLIGALGSEPIPGRSRVIELCNVDLNLTGQSLGIEDDTTLIASPACARGPHSLGPRIFVTDNRKQGKPLFTIRGDRVRFSGFRIEGPSPDSYQSDDRMERAIQIAPYDCIDRPQPDGTVVCVPEPIRNIEISNMEIYHWSGAAIDVRDSNKAAERGRLFNTNVGAVHIFDSFIHNNRHGDGNGYGVEVASGAYALIERNVFDLNRHAMMGGSREGNDLSGYTLRENLILSGGGRHCSKRWYFPFCWDTHQVDMHGDKSSWRDGGGSCCGTAGETIIIERNTILYDAGWAIKIRGNPSDKAVVDGNVFTHESRGDAIDQNGDPGYGDNITNPIDVRPNNVFNAKPMGALGACDFNADGQPDKFMATGVTWWMQSGATGQWSYLNTMPEVFPRLQLGDFDNDGRCDVGRGPANPAIPPTKYSKNGRGPWVPVIAGGSN